MEDEGRVTSRKQEPRAVVSAQTDDRGQYRIFGLQPGKYCIRASDYFEPGRDMLVDEDFFVQQFLGGEYLAAYYPGAAQARQAQAFSLKPSDEAVADVLLRRLNRVEVAGRVDRPNGPAADASVTLAPLEESEYGLFREDTPDEKGHFRLENVPEGSDRTVVSKRVNGDQFYESRARQKVEVNDNIDSLFISPSGGSTIRARVTVNGANFRNP